MNLQLIDQHWYIARCEMQVTISNCNCTWAMFVLNLSAFENKTKKIHSLWLFPMIQSVWQNPDQEKTNQNARISLKTTYHIKKWVIDQVWGQDGWILAKVFFACLWTETKLHEVHKLAIKEQGQYPTILTEQAWSIRDLLYGFWGNLSCGIQQVALSRQESSILPSWVANHSAWLGSSCLLTELRPFTKFK